MPVATKKPRTKHKLPPAWRWTADFLPGYNTVATSGDCWFDADAAEDVCDKFFGGALILIEGERAGQFFSLERWQRAIVGNLFGWKRPDGTRRYREAFIAVPRKNGKTPLAAGIALHLLLNDNEPGAQIYSAAADREQAALVFRHARGMVERNDNLAAATKVFSSFKTIESVYGLGVFKSISSEAGTKHGLNSHGVIIDELHAQPDSELVDVLTTSTGTRRQPLLVYITTSDFGRESICNTLWDRARRVRDGVIDEPSLLPAIWEADPDCDWTSPETWSAVNPNLGVSVKLDYLQQECRKAQDLPAYENTFKRLHLNIRTEQDVRWLPMDKWDSCGGEMPDLKGKPCFAGLDLASTTDVAALTLYFPESHALLPFFWTPSDTADMREQRARVTYRAWARQGFMTLTSGNVVDYDRIRVDINAIGKEYRIRGIAIDRWNSTQLQGQLAGDGFEVVQFGQGFRDMTSPTKELEKLVVSGKLRHGGNPVLRWMAGNVMAETDSAGNLKPSKKKSSEKIDGIVAAIMGIGLALVAEPERKKVPQCVML